VIGRHVRIEVEGAKQLVLRTSLLTHHRDVPSSLACASDSGQRRSFSRVFQQNRPIADVPSVGCIARLRTSSTRAHLANGLLAAGHKPALDVKIMKDHGFARNTSRRRLTASPDVARHR